jgi:hypothetical protein
VDATITLVPRPTVDGDLMERLRPAAALIYHNVASSGRCMDCRVRHFTGRMLCDECLAAKRAGYIRVPVKPFGTVVRRNARTIRRITPRPVQRIA